MTKIIYIDHSPKFSGAEKVLLNLLDLVKKSEPGISPVLVCPAGSDIVDYFKKAGIEIDPAEMVWFTRKAGLTRIFSYGLSVVSFSASLLKKIKKHDARIVQTNTFISALYAVIPVWLARRKMVWYMYDILDVDLVNKVFVRFAAFGADRIICASGAVKKRLVEFGVDEKKCAVIHNSILEQEAGCAPQASVRAGLGVPEDAPLVGMIGQITPWKGQEVFVKSIPEVLEKFPSARFVLVGDIMGPFDREYKEGIEKLIEREGLGDRVILAGFRKDIPAVMGSLDVVVHASIRPDALPTVILEAMFMEKPVVATAVGGVPEIIDDNESGLLVPPDDPVAMANAISRLLGSKIFCANLGRQGKRTLLEKFKPETYLKKVTGIYRELLDEKKIRRI